MRCRNGAIKKGGILTPPYKLTETHAPKQDASKVIQTRGSMQQINQWQEVMSAYHAAKFSAIPLNAKRLPYHKGWSRWNTELPEEPLYIPDQRGIGILPGPESGVMFVDIDTENPELLNALQKILPTSPVQRFGSKGVALVYSYNERIHSRKFQSIQVEIFADSGYVAIPPSYHEKTGGYYRWLGESLLDFPKDDLPTFSENVITILDKLDQDLKKHLSKDGKVERGGRHNALVAQAFAGLHNDKTVETIAEELAEYDLKRHEVSYFKEEHRAKDDREVFFAAKKFVENIQKTFKKKNPPPVEVIEEEVEAEEEDNFEIKSYPVPSGILGQINSLIEASAYTAVPNMAFGSSLAIFSTLIGHSYTFEGIAGNLFCLLLADSGTGKKFGLEVAKKLLAEHNRAFSANYLSGPSVSKDISDYCIRLDMSDEFSKTLALIKNGGVWQTSIPQELCDLWSASTGQYLNSAAKKVDAKAQALIEQPYVSILAATTVSEFKSSVNKSLFTSGLLPRCLFFIDLATKDSRPRLDHKFIETLTEELKIAFRSWILNNPQNPITNAPLWPNILSLDPSCAEYFDKKMTDFHHQTFDFLEGSPEKIMMTRKRESYKKLALLHSLSRCPAKPVIEKADLDWAETVFDISFHNQQLFLKEAASENDQQSLKERLYSIVLANPGITRRELARRTQSFSKKQRENIMEDLIDSERVFENIGAVGKNGKRLRSYAVYKSREN